MTADGITNHLSIRFFFIGNRAAIRNQGDGQAPGTRNWSTAILDQPTRAPDRDADEDHFGTTTLIS